MLSRLRGAVPHHYRRRSGVHALVAQAPRALSSAAAERIVFASPHRTVPIPDETIWDVVAAQAAQIGERPAFVCGLTDESVSFQQLHDDALKVAAGLRADGIKKGDVVLMHSFNCMEYPATFLALSALGAVCSTASPLMLAKDLARQAQAANARAIITNRALESVAIEAAELVGLNKNCIYAMGTTPADSRVKSINELTRWSGKSDFIPSSLDPDAVAVLPFSSGTTGMPKGVALSGRNLMANTVQVTEIEDLGKTILGLLPFFHIYGLFLLHLGIYQGSTKVVLPRFEPETFLTAMTKHRIEKAHIAPPVALFLANHPLVDKFDLTATKFLVSGGAPMGKEVEGLVKKRIGVGVKQAYGMTEASPAVNYSEDDLRKEGSVGRLIPNTELRVRCTLIGKDLGANEPGELLYRGPQVMKGYLNNPKANQAVFTDDGFLCTGDIGLIDEDGFVFVLDRVKELIKYKAYQVPPAELEDVLNHHPAISDACCVRGKDPATGEEVPKAYVVRKDPMLTEQEVMDFVASKVPSYKKVRQVEFIEAIPKSPTGKILRRILQE
ncbi:TPA: hypothetical protein N0F65_004807, partial [Lagenidium giganteum]